MAACSARAIQAAVIHWLIGCVIVVCIFIFSKKINNETLCIAIMIHIRYQKRIWKCPEFCNLWLTVVLRTSAASSTMQQQRSHSTADRGSGEAMPSVGIGIWQSEHRTVALQIAAPVDQISSVLVIQDYYFLLNFSWKFPSGRNCCGNFFYLVRKWYLVSGGDVSPN